MTQHPTDAADRTDPIRIVCLVALATSHGLIRLAERYLPEFVVAIGSGPIVAGALVSLGLGVAVAASRRSSDADAGPTSDLAPAAAAVASVLVAAVGLLAWAGAPTLDALLGTPLSALGWLAVGIVLLQAWHVHGPVRDLWPTDTRASAPPSSAVPARNETSIRRGAVDRRRTWIVVGALGLAAAAVFAAAAVANAGGVRAGFAIVTATGAAVTLVGAVALGSAGERTSTLAGRVLGDGLAEGNRDSESETYRDETTTAAPADAESPLGAVSSAASRLPDRRRWAVVGDALVRVALAGSWPFLILLVVEYRSIGLSVGGLSLAPAAVFGLFVLAEAAGAVVGAVAAPALASQLDQRAVLAVGLAVVSLLPMGLVAAPSNAGIVAVLFALLGCRTAIEPLRPTVGESARVAPVPGPRLPDAVGTAVQAAVVPAPLIGGLLYAVDPIFAFTIATTVGLLGVRELGRAFAFGRP
ncbi:transporter [Haloterrigena salifodinae]|uniref:Transporter n=1 Tax=Haloterrigena salifodinae TaxID=2675099 RepID=A0A8T8E2B6_9EURY|nr:transporter [Haloterrigena salifodinae]QRV15727.1 transporter [Haloterrigena salifodinae]